MWYEIFVSRNENGLRSHLFTTAKRSCPTQDDAKRVYQELCKRFPAKEGWEVTVTRWEETGTKVVWYDRDEADGEES